MREHGDDPHPRFRELARARPAELVALLSTDLPPHQLTFAAEIAGTEIKDESVVAPLVKLLEHTHAVVREGAVYGLVGHASETSVAAMRKAFAIEKSPGAQEAMWEWLDEFDQRREGDDQP